ncbi:MAG: tRNA (adenosine(37)-N6)-threonylcarbamoyltransferase complex ATPase subunit type 1 TsaE [Eubacteriales bacterium]|nr:tRNA (adenosine(37)-N6)-threonylcarbamoyltransferase complex ATPase subunit type 1 TsaE [Eubacteriales bacterium]
MAVIEIESKSLEETCQLAALLVPLLRRGDILALDGELGAGKTHFTAGLAAAMGITEPVASPTFTLMQAYALPVSLASRLGEELYHFDAYRLENSEAFFKEAFDEYFDLGICIIEWAELIAELLPERSLYLRFDRVEASLDGEAEAADLGAECLSELARRDFLASLEADLGSTDCQSRRIRLSGPRERVDAVAEAWQRAGFRLLEGAGAGSSRAESEAEL